MLLVEDDEGDAVLVADDLAERLPGAVVSRTRSLAEALERVPEHYDCVLLDLGLPDASGLSGVRRMRERFPDAALVVLTGLADEAAGVGAVQAGAQDYLVKGRLEPGQLARAIRYSIGRRLTAEAERELLLADAQAREVERLELGLAPPPLIDETDVWVVSCNRPGRSRALLGGDFLDLVQRSDRTLHALIGDVCGHGPDEAAIGVSLRAAWRALTLAGVAHELLFDTLARVLEHERQLPRLFATLCTIDIELPERAAHVLAAGHPAPLLIDASGRVERLTGRRGAPALGLGDGPWTAETVALPDGWSVLLYTDGVIEGRLGEGPDRLGEDGLRRVLGEHIAARPDWRVRPQTLLDELVQEAERLNGGALTDDVALLLIGAAAR